MLNPYETDSMISQYLEFQYGPEYFGVANYAQRLVGLALEHCASYDRALDIGCATGRASFELARHFRQVIGMDYSARFIDVALQLTSGEDFRYVTQEEGDLVEYRQVRLKDVGLGAEQAQRIQFVQGDACNLKPQPEGFDLVLASNLIDRLRQPQRFLHDITRMIRSGGVLMLSSPYTWLEEFTARRRTGWAVSVKTARRCQPIRRCNACWRPILKRSPRRRMCHLLFARRRANISIPWRSSPCGVNANPTRGRHSGARCHIITPIAILFTIAHIIVCSTYYSIIPEPPWQIICSQIISIAAS